MASSSSMTNDEIKHRILNKYAKFVSDVEPDRLSDWLVQESVITIDQSQRIQRKNDTNPERCRALLHLLFSSQHPTAFITVREALLERNHYLLQYIDSQESGSEFRAPSDIGPMSQDRAKLQQLQKNDEDQRRRWEDEKDHLLKTQKTLETKILMDKNRIEELEKENKDQRRAWEEEKDRLLKMQHKHEDKERASKEEKDCQKKMQNEHDDRRGSSEECIRLLNMQQELDTELHPETPETDYKSDPVFFQKIVTKASSSSHDNILVNGLAMLDKELFVVSEESSTVEVYDSIKFNFKHEWSLREMIDPRDIGSCERNKCLYIMDYKQQNYSKEIFRVDPSGKVIKNWSTEDDYGPLNVTNELNVILTVFNTEKLLEYSPDGVLVHKITLPIYPRGLFHAIKLKNGDFVVSCGPLFGDSDSGAHVCVMDEKGTHKKEFNGNLSVRPICLSVDRNGFVYILDQLNLRVLLLNPDLKFKRVILSKEKHKLQGPSKIFLDEANGRFFVVNNNTRYVEGQISVFTF